jgi:hypothetical protein
MNYFFNLFLKQYLLNLLLKKVYNTSLKTNIFYFSKFFFYNLKCHIINFYSKNVNGGLTNAKGGKLGGPKLHN